MEEENKNKKNKVLKKKKVSKKIEISWVCREFPSYGENIFIRIFILVCLIAVMIFGLIYDSWSFSLAIFAFLVVQHILHKNDNSFVKVELKNDYVKFGNRVYKYERIKEFWFIDEEHLVKTLVINVKKDLAGDIFIQLADDVAIKDIRKFLSNHISENKDKQLTFFDRLSFLFKF